MRDHALISDFVFGNRIEFLWNLSRSSELHISPSFPRLLEKTKPALEAGPSPVLRRYRLLFLTRKWIKTEVKIVEMKGSGKFPPKKINSVSNAIKRQLMTFKIFLPGEVKIRNGGYFHSIPVSNAGEGHLLKFARGIFGYGKVMFVGSNP